MAAFPLKSQLPVTTQREIDRVSAITAALRNVTEAAFLVRLAPYLTNEILLQDVNNLVLMAAGNTLPTGLTGFRKGALFIKKDATGNGLYNNTGDETSATWNLVDQADTADIPDGAITLAKMANMATASIIGRVTAATGVPQVLSVAQVKTLLGITDGLSAYSAGTPVNAVASQGTLTVTSGGNQIADGYKVTIDAKQYTFKTALTPTEGEILVGANDTASLLNLKNAINHTGTPDTDYKCAAVHPTVTGVSSNGTTLIVASKVKGVVGNALVSTVTAAAELSWNGTTLGTTVLGVNGTVATQWQSMVDSSYIYVAIAVNTIADTNWRRIALGSAY